MSEYTFKYDPVVEGYEIVRWDSYANRVVVQTNIRTREKALQACQDWIQRERDANAKPD